MKESLTKPKKPQILIKRKYSHNIQKVWEAITNKEALSNWLMETTDFSIQENTQFQFKTKPQGNFDGIINCQILAVTPPKTLVYSWDHKSFNNPTTVTWELHPINEEETILILSHSGFEGVGGWITKQILRMGWKKLLTKELSNYLQA